MNRSNLLRPGRERQGDNCRRREARLQAQKPCAISELVCLLWLETEAVTPAQMKAKYGKK
jgi:hypothetical protein